MFERKVQQTLERRKREPFREKKVRWFHAGVADFARVCPDAIASLGTDGPPVYACPLCITDTADGRLKFRLFIEDSLRDETLTADHVPPRHRGGQYLVLTCKDCNSGDGHTIDAAAYAVEQTFDFLAGRAAAPIQMRVGNRIVRATWMPRNSDDTQIINVAPAHPDHLDAFKREFPQVIAAREPIKFTVSVKDPNDRQARISWLKSAYLATFALFGYGYILHPALARVRRQIQQPGVEIVQMFMVRLPHPFPFSDRRIFPLVHPDLPPCWVVQMGPILVFMPAEQTDRLYEHLQELRQAGGSFEFATKWSRWPTQPLFPFAPINQAAS